MNYIKRFESYSDEDLIHKLCAKFKITDYIINDDYSIDVSGDVNLAYSKGIKRLPLRFRNVTGYFFCMGNSLTTLKGCPEYVGGDFCCSSNKLTNMEFSPKKIEGCVDYRNNMITSLKYAPNDVSEWINVNDNNLPIIMLELVRDVDKLKILIKHQDEYGIWKDDGEFNPGRYDIFIKDFFEK